LKKKSSYTFSKHKHLRFQRVQKCHWV